MRITWRRGRGGIIFPFSLFLSSPPAIIEASRQAVRFLINFLANETKSGDDWLMYWMEPSTRRAPEFPNPWHSSPERGEKQMIYYRRGPISFQVSFARSKRGNRSKGGVNAASTKYIYRHTDIQTSLETIFRIFRIFVDPFLSACNFVKFCFSISGIGCLVTDRFFPFFELDQAPLLLLVAEKKRNSLASYPWLDKNIHKVTMIHVQLYTIYLIEPAIYMYI